MVYKAVDSRKLLPPLPGLSGGVGIPVSQRLEGVKKSLDDQNSLTQTTGADWRRRPLDKGTSQGAPTQNQQLTGSSQREAQSRQGRKETKEFLRLVHCAFAPLREAGDFFTTCCALD
jgi:hypothetical protein